MQIDLATLVLDWLEHEFKDVPFSLKEVGFFFDVYDKGDYLLVVDGVPVARITHTDLRPWIWPSRSFGLKAAIVNRVIDISKSYFNAADPEFFNKMKKWLIFDVFPSVRATSLREKKMASVVRDI